MKKPGTELAGYLGPKVRIQGEVFTESTLRLDGLIEGTIVVKEELVMGPEGRVKGKIVGHRITVAGTVEGDIYALGAVGGPARLDRPRQRLRPQDHHSRRRVAWTDPACSAAFRRPSSWPRPRSTPCRPGSGLAASGPTGHRSPVESQSYERNQLS